MRVTSGVRGGHELIGDGGGDEVVLGILRYPRHTPRSRSGGPPPLMQGVFAPGTGRAILGRCRTAPGRRGGVLAPAHLAVRRVVQSGEYPQQGGFPDSRRSHERSDGAGAHVQIDVPQQDGVTRRIVDIGAARAVVASHVLSWRRSRRAGSTVVVRGPVPCSPDPRAGHVHPDGLHHGGPGAPRISGSGGWLRGPRTRRGSRPCRRCDPRCPVR